MSLVSEIITQDQIQDLWGCGFTIVARRQHPDPFFVPQEMVPQGYSYQWCHLVHDRPPLGWHHCNWAAVPASRHDGYFMPFGHTGDIEVNGLGLFEKPKFEVDQEHAQNVVAAHKQVEDWLEKTGEMFSGEVKFGDVKANVGDEPRDVFASSKSKTIETTVKIPKEMVPHMAAIFAERDRLKDEIVLPDRSIMPGPLADKFYAAVEEDKSLPWWPTLHAILLPIAIENVRKKLVEDYATESYKDENQAYGALFLHPTGKEPSPK